MQLWVVCLFFQRHWQKFKNSPFHFHRTPEQASTRCVFFLKSLSLDWWIIFQWNLPLFYFQVQIQEAWFEASLRLHIVWWVLSVHSSALFRHLLICEPWVPSTAAERINQPTAEWLKKTGQLTFDTELRCLVWLWILAVMDVSVQLRVSFMAQSLVWFPVSEICTCLILFRCCRSSIFF